MDQETEKLASEVVDALYTVHRELGPGLLESVYEECLAVELAARKLASLDRWPFQSAFAASTSTWPSEPI